MIEASHFSLGEDGGRPLVEVEDILAVHGLAVNYARHRARTRSLRAFVLRDGTKDIYDGNIDTYFGCSIRQPAPDQTRMTISFLTSTNLRELATVNNRELFIFDWLKDGRCQAWYAQPELKRPHLALPFDFGEQRPLTPDDCVELRQRMNDIVERVNPILPGSIFEPRQ